MKKPIFIFLWVLCVFSCEEIINEENITNEAVLVLAPANNATLKTNTQLNYRWQELIGATSYKLQIAIPNFSNATQLKLDTLISSPTFTIDSLQQGAYEWRVKALNSAYETGYVVNGFTVEK